MPREAVVWLRWSTVGIPFPDMSDRDRVKELNAEKLQANLRALFGPELVIERELGRGGMAAVFRAFDPGQQRHVAVKMLLPEVAIHADLVARFVREARTTAALKHPHVASIYGVRSADNAHAIIMQCVDGPSLDALIARDGAMPPARAARLLSQVASGLQHAHERGVVHRDVKPSNVLVDVDDHAYVSDFGIARRDDGGVVTSQGLVLGSLDYMSPEQRAGERVTPAADQYAFGVMAFELLTGHLPFRGTATQVIVAHMQTPAPSMRAIVPDVPPEIDALISRMLAKDPAQRWPSLEEAIERFDTLAGGPSVVKNSARKSTRNALVGADVERNGTDAQDVPDAVEPVANKRLKVAGALLSIALIVAMLIWVT